MSHYVTIDIKINNNKKADWVNPNRLVIYKFNLAATCSPTCTPCSTIGAGGLYFRVRHGAGCVPAAMTAINLYCLSKLKSYSKKIKNKKESFDY